MITFFQINYVWSFRKYPKSAIWAYPLFLVLPSNVDNFVRQYFATAFFFIGLFFFHNKEIKKTVLFFASAVMMAQTTDIKKIKVIEPVEKWLSLIYHADFVLTDSFHGTVFSILFHKPFIVFANEDRGKDRFTDLLTRMGLQERLIQKGSSENLAIFDKTIDWLSVESMLCKEKKKSYDFLYNALRHSS